MEQTNNANEPKKILIIDDTDMMRNLLKTILTGAGYVICGEADDGKNGAKLYQETKPDLVLLDIIMPEVDGLQCLKEILQADPKAKVVMVSAMGQQDYIADALMAGALEFIVKPFQAKAVLDTVERILSI